MERIWLLACPLRLQNYWKRSFGKLPEEASLSKIREELADILNYAFQMADKYNLDIKEIMLEKIQRNAEKYPVEKAKGSAKKYNEL